MRSGYGEWASDVRRALLTTRAVVHVGPRNDPYMRLVLRGTVFSGYWGTYWGNTNLVEVYTSLAMDK